MELSNTPDEKLSPEQKRALLKTLVRATIHAQGLDPVKNYNEVFKDVLTLRPALALHPNPPDAPDGSKPLVAPAHIKAAFARGTNGPMRS